MKPAVLITGGANRIGKALGLHLAALGFDIALHYNTSTKDAQNTASEIRSAKIRCEMFGCDLTDTAKTSHLIGDVKKKFPRLNLLINSASAFGKSNLDLNSLGRINQDIAIHFKAPFILISEFARLCQRGQIINFLDTNVSKHKTAYTTYLLAKKSLENLTKLAAVELAPHIRVNAIAPGLILPPVSQTNSYLDRLAKKIPLKRKGNHTNITQTVDFLVQNNFLTGQTIFVDGGEHLV